MCGVPVVFWAWFVGCHGCESVALWKRVRVYASYKGGVPPAHDEDHRVDGVTVAEVSIVRQEEEGCYLHGLWLCRWGCCAARGTSIVF